MSVSDTKGKRRDEEQHFTRGNSKKKRKDNRRERRELRSEFGSPNKPISIDEAFSIEEFDE
jgi:hypothetical protein